MKKLRCRFLDRPWKARIDGKSLCQCSSECSFGIFRLVVTGRFGCARASTRLEGMCSSTLGPCLIIDVMPHQNAMMLFVEVEVFGHDN